MVSTCGLIHQHAASSILALSTRDLRCAAEKTVICWCGIKPRVTGAALRAALGLLSPLRLAVRSCAMRINAAQAGNEDCVPLLAPRRSG
jgi:hypothetical protein